MARTLVYCVLVAGAGALSSGPSLLSASSVVKSLSVQAGSLEQKVVQAEMASEAKIERQRALFDSKLKQQEQSSVEAIAENGKISKQIQTLKNANAAMANKNKALKATNHVMEMELKIMNKKLHSAGDFALKNAASFLQIAAAPNVVDASAVVMSNSFVEAMGDLVGAGNESPAQGIKQVAGPVANPDTLLDGITRDVANLKAQEKASEASVKQQFVKSYRAGSKRHAAILLKQKSLKAQRSVLAKEHMVLKKEETHLLTAKTELQHNLHNLGEYLQNLAHLADTPAAQVPHMLRSMPKNVAA